MFSKFELFTKLGFIGGFNDTLSMYLYFMEDIWLTDD